MQDMLKVEIWTIARTDQGNAVLLRPLGSDISVPIFIGPLEAQYILIGCGEQAIRRPLTPDLFLTLVRQVGLELKRVEVHELKNNTFHARLVLSGGEYTNKEPLMLDARPSDAFALAVRRKCPIYVARRVVEQAGVPVNLIMEEVEEAGRVSDSFGPFDTDLALGDGTVLEKRQRLQAELEEAINTEEYERAAEIRDILILLNNEAKGDKNSKI
jgi:bifunctional DNase/RNase